MNNQKKDELSKLRIFIAMSDDLSRDTFINSLCELERDNIKSISTARELVESSIRENPDLIISNAKLPDFDGITALVQISAVKTIPAIIVTEKRSLEVVERALEDHVMAYMLEPVVKEEILPTIYLVLRRFEQLKELEKENENLKQALADRRLIEKAKGVIMKRANIDEDTAYRRLRRMATDKRMKMIEVARQILSVNDLLTEPEKTE